MNTTVALMVLNTVIRIIDHLQTLGSEITPELLADRERLADTLAATAQEIADSDTTG